MAAAIRLSQQHSCSFDHLVGEREQLVGKLETKRPGGLEVDHKLVLSWCLHRKVGWLLTLEDTVDIAGRAPILVGVIRSVGDQAAGSDMRALVIDRGQFVPGCKGDDQIAMKHCREAP